MAGLEDNTLRIVLVGRTGSGKSATANTILGKRVFDSKIASGSVTTGCQRESRDWKGRKLIVVDTPGLFDTKETLETTCNQVSQCVLFSSPGPHAIILVVQLGRFTQEEHNTVELIKAIFGKPAMKHMAILFTRKDELDGQNLNTFLADADQRLKSIILGCENRYCAFNNKEAEAGKEAQVKELVELIEAMVQRNGGNHFSDPIYKETEEKVKRLEEALNQIRVDQSRREKAVEELCAQKKISNQEKEEKVKAIQEESNRQLETVKKEEEKTILESISNWIKRKLLALADVAQWFSAVLGITGSRSGSQ